MFIILGKKTTFTKAFGDMVSAITSRVENELQGIRTISDLSGRVKELREQIATLEIDRSKKEESFARREREIEHKVGLEKMRQEQEIDLARKQARLDANTEGLKKDQQRFEDQMKFHNERFVAEVKYQRELLEKMMERLPTAEILANFGGGSKK